jgi:predicted transposase/invertase (TIGR01784 family)
MSPAEMWAIFFKYADSPKHRELISEIANKKGEINLATRLLSSISKDEDERARYHSRRIYMMDMEHTKAVYREEGIKEGIKEGKAEGIKEGEARGEARARLEMARAMINYGDSIEKAARIAGISVEELRKRL